ncbi:MAG: PAS domain S-box protein [Candidatus Scalindua sp.]|nr:PAS domain S-box protein [Candidatus Scalindua sp.]
MTDSNPDKHSEDQLKTFAIAVEQSPSTIVITDIKGNIEYVNPKFSQLTGYSAEEAIGQNPRILKTDNTSLEVYKNLWKTILSGDVWRGEFCNKNKNGELYWESASISPVKNREGSITHFVAVKEDINERKQMEIELNALNESLEYRVVERTEKLRKQNTKLLNEIIKRELSEEALRENEEKFRRITSSAYDTIIMVNDEGKISFWNEAAARMFGRSREEVVGKDLHKLIVPERYYDVFKKHMDTFRQGGTGPTIKKTLVLPGLRKDGTEFLADHSFSSVMIKNKWQAIFIIRDVTERSKLVDQEKRIIFVASYSRSCQDFIELKAVFELTTKGLAELLNVQRVSVWLLDDTNNLICQKLYKYQEALFSKGEVLSGERYHDYIKAIRNDYPIDAHNARTDLRTKEFLDDYLIPSNIYSMLDIPIKLKGKISGVLCLEQAEHIRHWQKDEIDFANTITALLSNAIDRISERKKAEEELNIFNNLINQSNDAIFVVNTNTNSILNANEEAYKSLGYEPEELLKANVADIMPMSNRKFQDIFEKIKEIGTMVLEAEHKRKDGTTFPVEVNAKVVTFNEKSYILAIARDITERKRAEEQIKASLKEKEVLLDEVHHRVKNNLQIISSLLDISSMQTQSHETIRLFAESRGRVEAMSLIHSQLYESERFDEIDMEKHIHELSGNLLKVYSKEKIITLDIKSANVYLPVTQAVPCALVLNELISNSLKYAYRDGQQGIISIYMQQNGTTTIAKIKDNGIGIPEEIDIEKPNSLGLKLVRNIVRRQLNGTVKVVMDNGTGFTVEFKHSKENS